MTVTFRAPGHRTGKSTINNAEVCGNVQNGLARCEVSFALTSFPDLDLLASFIVPFVSGLITLGIGIAVLALRARKPTAQVVTGVCLTISVFMLGIFDINTTHQLTPLWIIGTTFAGAAMAAMALVFPVKLPIVYRRPGDQLAAAGCSARWSAAADPAVVLQPRFGAERGCVDLVPAAGRVSSAW